MSEADALIITKICRQLDGIALAIELAAARMNVLTPAQLHDRLAERFRILSGSNRDLLPRQKTLLATIDWSHDLLDEREKLIFRRIGTFVDGFTLDGAAAVCADESLDSMDVFDALASLVDKSLIVAEFSDDALRYRLLESMRAYARRKLEIAQNSTDARSYTSTTSWRCLPRRTRNTKRPWRTRSSLSWQWSWKTCEEHSTGALVPAR